MNPAGEEREVLQSTPMVQLLLEPSGGFHRKLLLAHSIADICIDLEYHAFKIIPRTFEGAVHCNVMTFNRNAIAEPRGSRYMRRSKSAAARNQQPPRMREPLDLNTESARPTPEA